ncbi:MAG: response regulator transcription factor [Phycisphaerae bacterium]|nr:response regulator transcription factor [Phycisphaerae bacterium]
MRNESGVHSTSSGLSNHGEIRVLLVDDHPIVRQGVQMLVDAENGMAVCGTAETVAGALEAIPVCKPTIAIVDLSLKDGSGLDLIKDMRIRFPDVAILVLSMRDDAFYAERALRAGAMGYITKEQGTERIAEGIRRVLAGEIYLTDDLSSQLLGRMVDSRAAVNAPSINNLTDRELQVFDMIGQGKSTREIAAALHLSVKTIESHREHVKDKLGIANGTELLKRAIQWTQVEGNA